MTCMSLYPRSATVRAATDCVMFEMLRNVLDIIQRNKTSRRMLEANYRRSAPSKTICAACRSSRPDRRISSKRCGRRWSWSAIPKAR